MKIAIHTPTEVEYNELMQYLESKGYFWASGKKPTAHNCWRTYEKDTDVIVLVDYELTYSAKSKGSIPFSELKAKNYKIEVQL
jgi:hypothetical protein